MYDPGALRGAAHGVTFGFHAPVSLTPGARRRCRSSAPRAVVRRGRHAEPRRHREPVDAELRRRLMDMVLVRQRLLARAPHGGLRRRWARGPALPRVLERA